MRGSSNACSKNPHFIANRRGDILSMTVIYTVADAKVRDIFLRAYACGRVRGMSRWEDARSWCCRNQGSKLELLNNKRAAEIGSPTSVLHKRDSTLNKFRSQVSVCCNRAPSVYINISVEWKNITSAASYLFLLLPFCLLEEILLFSFPFENESGRLSAIYGARLAACERRLHNANAAEKCDQFSIKQMLCSIWNVCVRAATQ